MRHAAQQFLIAASAVVLIEIGLGIAITPFCHPSVESMKRYLAPVGDVERGNVVGLLGPHFVGEKQRGTHEQSEAFLQPALRAPET